MFYINHFTKLALVSSIALAMLSGCSKPEEKSASSTAENSKLSITFATEGAYKPFNYVDTEGSLVGFDVDIANALCEKMNAKCDIVAQDWDGIIPGLIARKYDAIIAGMSITEERSKVVDFSEAYFVNSLVYIGKKEDNVEIASLNKRSIGAQRSTVASQYLEDNLSKNNDIKLYDSQENAYLDLVAGRTTLMLSDKVPALDWLKTKEGANFELKGDEIDIDDKLGIAVRKDDVLKAKLDAALNQMKEDGTYQKISDSYFK